MKLRLSFILDDGAVHSVEEIECGHDLAADLLAMPSRKRHRALTLGLADAQNGMALAAECEAAAR